MPRSCTAPRRSSGDSRSRRARTCTSGSWNAGLTSDPDDALDALQSQEVVLKPALVILTDESLFFLAIAVLLASLPLITIDEKLPQHVERLTDPEQIPVAWGCQLDAEHHDTLASGHEPVDVSRAGHKQPISARIGVIPIASFDEALQGEIAIVRLTKSVEELAEESRLDAALAGQMQDCVSWCRHRCAASHDASELRK
jgi:hypothetical protein